MKQYAGIIQEYLFAASFNKSLKILTMAGSKKRGFLSLVQRVKETQILPW
jgi:hypothetical protein